MSALPPTGINWVEAMQPLEAVASLAEWCEGDPRLMARARADVLRDKAPTAGAERTKHDAVQLLDLVASAS